MTSIDLKTSGMHCGACSMLIEMNVGELAGVQSVRADRATEITHVEFDPAVVTVDEIIKVLGGAGYPAEVAA
jgi:copper chaperone CopZ